MKHENAIKCSQENLSQYREIYGDKPMLEKDSKVLFKIANDIRTCLSKKIITHV